MASHHTGLITYRLWPLQRYKCRAERLWQKTYSPQSWKYLLTRPLQKKFFNPLVTTTWVDKEPGLFPIEVLVIVPLFCLISQFRTRCTSIIYGDLVHMSCVAHAFLTMQNTHYSTPSHGGWGSLQSLRLSAGLSCLPSFLTSPISESSDPSWWESTAVILLPQVTSVHYVETTCVPRASGKRWKMIWKRHSGSCANRNEGCFQEGWTAMGGIHTAWGAFRNGGLLQHGCCPQESSKETVDQPRKMKNTPQRLVPRCITASIVLPIFFGRNACLFGENKPTALMDNAGEGTLGTGLWERKFEQKKPFTLLSVSPLIKKKKPKPKKQS